MTDGAKQYLAAVSKYDELCETRTDPSQWSENIIDASVGITENIAWTNFYSYMADDQHAYSERKTRTLDDALKDGPILPANSTIRLKEKWIQNGTVTHILVTPDISQYIEKDDGRKKSVDQLPEIVDEKSPR